MSFDQLAALLVVNLATWALLDYLHAAPHAPLALDGLFGWACYLLLGLAACGFVARVQDRAAPTRSLLVPALAVAPFVLIVFWLALDLALVSRHILIATLVALVYLVFLALRVLGAAFGPVRVRPALLAVAFVIASPWVLGVLSLDTRLWVAEEPAQAEEPSTNGDFEYVPMSEWGDELERNR